MPWKTSFGVPERMGFVARLFARERMSDLCVEFGISRRTGYKLRDRYPLGPKRCLMPRAGHIGCLGSQPSRFSRGLVDARNGRYLHVL